MSMTKRTILAIDDDPSDAILLQRYLQRVLGDEMTFRHAAEPEEAMAMLADEDVDLVFLDYELGSLTGLDMVRGIRSAGDIRPIIIVTDHGNEYIATDVIRSGADDYVIKSDMDPETLRRSMETAEAQYACRKVGSENRKLIEDLKARNKEILQLAYAMTHDLQTPLASLTGAADALADHLVNVADEQTRRWLDRISGSVDRMTRMLDDLMSYARTGSEELRIGMVDTRALLETCCNELAQEAAAAGVQLEIGECLPIVRGDPYLLHRAFSNLLSNAIKFLAIGSGDRVRVRFEGCARMNRFCVEDNGPGIDPGQLDNVFLPFKRATNKAPGSGVGLATVRRIIEKHGGSVWAQSDGRSGTRVIVELPAALHTQRAMEEALI